MTTLKDLIVAVLNDFTEARIESDAYFTEISQKYLKDRFLQHLPAPRFEITQAQIEVNIGIHDIDKNVGIIFNSEELSKFSPHSVTKLQFSLLSKQTHWEEIKDEKGNSTYQLIQE